MSGVTLAPGARVRADRDICTRFARVAVPAGALGSVEQVRHYGTVVVRFDNGRRLGVSETFLSVVRNASIGGTR